MSPRQLTCTDQSGLGQQAACCHPPCDVTRGLLVWAAQSCGTGTGVGVEMEVGVGAVVATDLPGSNL